VSGMLNKTYEESSVFYQQWSSVFVFFLVIIIIGLTILPLDRMQEVSYTKFNLND